MYVCEISKKKKKEPTWKQVTSGTNIYLHDVKLLYRILKNTYC
jgi:hypothetical protein